MNDFFQILLVEDDEDDVDLLKSALDENGVSFHMDVIVSGDKVIPWLQSSAMLPEVIVLDLNLPKMHGLDVLRTIKSHPHFSTIPIMVHTTSSSQRDIDACFEAGAEKYMNKACTIIGFKQVVDTITTLATSSK